MKRLRQVLGVVVMLAVTTVAGFYAYQRFGPEPAQAAIPNTIIVAPGSLTATVSATGNVAAPTQVQLGFKTSGTLQELLVDVGTEVQASQVLARLDTVPLASALRQAEANFRSAVVKLDELQAGLRAEDLQLSEVAVESASLKLAQARSNTTDVQNAEGSVESAALKLRQLQEGGTDEDVATARLQLAAAVARLAALQKPTQRDIQAANASLELAKAKLAQLVTPRAEDVANAEGALKSAKAKLDRLVTPSVEDVRTAEGSLAAARAKLDRLHTPVPEDVRTAQASLVSATAKLDRLLRPTAEDTAAARLSLDQAQTRLAQIIDAPPVGPEDLANAELSVRNAQISLDKARSDAATNSSLSDIARTTMVQQAEISLQQAQNNLNKLRAQGPSDWELRLQQLSVESAQKSLDKLLNPSAADIASAEASVRQAEASLNKLLNPSVADVIAAEVSVQQAAASLNKLLNPSVADVIAAEVSVQQAEASLNKLLSPSVADIASAETSVRQAENSLYKLRNPSAADIASAEASVNQAQTALNKLLTPDSFEVAQQQLSLAQAGRQLLRAGDTLAANIESAELALRQAELQHQVKIAPATDQELASAAASLEGAQVQLEKAQRDLTNAALTSPIAGIIAVLSASVGEQVGASPMVTVVDPTRVRVEVHVDETDIYRIRSGQQARLTFEALPDQRASGQVLVVTPTGTITQGVVNYQALIEFDREQALGLRPGMTATAEIVTESRQNVLVVPNRAIRRQGQARTVEVMLPDGTTQTRQVQVGLSNDQSTEITSGLQPGDTIIMPTTTTGSVFGRGGFGGGGGRGGGGFR